MRLGDYIASLGWTPLPGRPGVWQHEDRILEISVTPSPPWRRAATPGGSMSTDKSWTTNDIEWFEHNYGGDIAYAAPEVIDAWLTARDEQLAAGTITDTWTNPAHKRLTVAELPSQKTSWITALVAKARLGRITGGIKARLGSVSRKLRLNKAFGFAGGAGRRILGWGRTCFGWARRAFGSLGRSGQIAAATQLVSTKRGQGIVAKVFTTANKIVSKPFSWAIKLGLRLKDMVTRSKRTATERAERRTGLMFKLQYGLLGTKTGAKLVTRVHGWLDPNSVQMSVAAVASQQILALSVVRAATLRFIPKLGGIFGRIYTPLMIVSIGYALLTETMTGLKLRRRIVGGVRKDIAEVAEAVAGATAVPTPPTTGAPVSTKPSDKQAAGKMALDLDTLVAQLHASEVAQQQREGRGVVRSPERILEDVLKELAKITSQKLPGGIKAATGVNSRQKASSSK